MHQSLLSLAKVGKYGQGQAEPKIGHTFVQAGVQGGGQEFEGGKEGLQLASLVCLEGAKFYACTFPNIAFNMQHLRPPSLHDVVGGDDVELVAVLLMFCFLPIEALNSQLSARFQFTTELIQL